MSKVNIELDESKEREQLFPYTKEELEAIYLDPTFDIEEIKEIYLDQETS